MIYKISKEASNDLEKIWLYTIETWSAEQADRYLNLIFDAWICGGEFWNQVEITSEVFFYFWQAGTYIDRINPSISLEYHGFAF